MASDAGADKTYGLGDTVRVRVDFVDPVEVTGTPRLKIDMDPAEWGEKWASPTRAAAAPPASPSPTPLSNPTSPPRASPWLADTLELNGGTIRSDGEDAGLAHTGLAPRRQPQGGLAAVAGATDGAIRRCAGLARRCATVPSPASNPWWAKP